MRYDGLLRVTMHTTISRINPPSETPGGGIFFNSSPLGGLSTMVYRIGNVRVLSTHVFVETEFICYTYTFGEIEIFCDLSKLTCNFESHGGRLGAWCGASLSLMG